VIYHIETKPYLTTNKEMQKVKKLLIIQDDISFFIFVLVRVVRVEHYRPPKGGLAFFHTAAFNGAYAMRH